MAVSSKGISNPGQIDPKGAISASLLGAVGGGVSVTNYSQPHDVGSLVNGTAPGAATLDYILLALRQLCK